MAIPIPSPPGSPASTGNKLLRKLERERKEEEDARRAVWGFMWTLFWFKIVTIGIIWYVAAGSGEDLAMIMITTWYWLAIPVAAISGPLLFRWRMVRVRRRRDALMQSEWR
jgi:Flp pilus assembly protein TadB